MIKKYFHYCKKDNVSVCQCDVEEVVDDDEEVKKKRNARKAIADTVVSKSNSTTSFVTLKRKHIESAASK